MPSQAARLQRLPQYVFSVIGERIRELQKQGVSIARLDIGSPDLPPPDFVIEALQRSAHNPRSHGYSGYRGTASFREAVARYYQRRFDVDLNPETEVLPLIGSKEGIVNLCLAFLDEGDISLIPDISYPSYAMGAKLAGAQIAWLPMRPENQFLPDLSAVEEPTLSRAKFLWVNYPNNPTGVSADLSFYEQALRFCVQNDILLISDNPYVDLTFDDYSAPSALQVAKTPQERSHIVEFMSLSKTYNMAGWRLGAAVGAPEVLSALLKVKSNMDSGHFLPIYDAGSAALNDVSAEWIYSRNAIYQKRRDTILSALSDLGLQADKPTGALYIWASPIDLEPLVYIEQALTHAHVSLAPGEAYGPGGSAYIRISLSVADDELEQALQRLRQWRGR